MTEHEILSLVQEFRRDAESGLQDRFRRMKRCRDFKIGKQWDKEVENYNKARRKHTLTINRILPVVLDLCGLQSQNQRDIKAYNRKGGTITVAKVLSALAKHAMDESHAQYELNNAFDNAVTSAVGYVHVHKDMTDDPKSGQLSIEKLNPFHVYPDPNVQEYDHNKSGKYITFDKYPNKDELEARYPQKKEQLSDAAYSTAPSDTTWGRIVRFLYPSWFRGSKEEGYSDVEGDSASTRGKYRYRESHTYWKEWKKCVYLYNLSEQTEPKIFTKAGEMQAAKRAAADYRELLSAHESTTSVLHHTIWSGNVFLEDIEDPYDGLNLFPVVPIYAYWEDGYAFSVVENLIGPQQEHNWARSQVLNIIRRIANTGFIGKKFMPGYAEKLRDASKEEFMIIDASQAGGEIKQLEPADLPRAHEFVAARSAQDILEIAQPPSEPPGSASKNLSGYAIALRERDRIKNSAKLFENFDYSMRLISEVVVAMIRHGDIYTLDEIRAIVDEKDLIDARLLNDARQILREQGIELPPPPVELLQAVQQTGANPMLLNQLQAEIQTYQQAQKQYDQLGRSIAEQLIIEELKTMKAGKYGIKIALSAYAPTQRIANFVEITELHKLLVESAQPGIAREQLIEATDLTNKEEIKANVPGIVGK